MKHLFKSVRVTRLADTDSLNVIGGDRSMPVIATFIFALFR
jgi:hypothetical protein